MDLTRKTVKRACGTKRVFSDIKQAGDFCSYLLKLKPQVNPLTFYQCPKCEGIHVGHLGKGESILMYGGYSEDVREIQGCIS